MYNIKIFEPSPEWTEEERQKARSNRSDRAPFRGDRGGNRNGGRRDNSGRGGDRPRFGGRDDRR